MSDVGEVSIIIVAKLDSLVVIFSPELLVFGLLT